MYINKKCEKIMAQLGILVLRAESTAEFDYSIKGSFEYISNVGPLGSTFTHFGMFCLYQSV